MILNNERKGSLLIYLLTYLFIFYYIDQGTEWKGPKNQLFIYVEPALTMPFPMIHHCQTVLDIWELVRVGNLDNLGGNEKRERSPWYERMKRVPYEQGRIKESHFGTHQ